MNFDKNKNIAFPLALLMAWVFQSAPVMAWTSPGHMISALIAYDQLDADTRAKVVALLRHHPRFEEDFTAQMPPNLDNAETDRWIFAHAAAWPDMTRNFTGDAKTKYNRPFWHFVDKPIFLDATAQDKEHPTTNPDADPALASSESAMNLLQALNASIADLNLPDEKMPLDQKAVMLCWMMHLVGDIHQPLHCAALVSAARFRELPSGDRGGNGIPITEDQGLTTECRSGANLHCLWDNLPGQSVSLGKVNPRVVELEKNYPRSSISDQRLAAGDVQKWMDESYALARTAAYTPDVLAAVEQGETHPHAPLPPLPISDDYIAAARKVADLQITLTGYRLADLLTKARGM